MSTLFERGRLSQLSQVNTAEQTLTQPGGHDRTGVVDLSTARMPTICSSPGRGAAVEVGHGLLEYVLALLQPRVRDDCSDWPLLPCPASTLCTPAHGCCCGKQRAREGERSGSWMTTTDSSSLCSARATTPHLDIPSAQQPPPPPPLLSPSTPHSHATRPASPSLSSTPPPRTAFTGLTSDRTSSTTRTVAALRLHSHLTRHLRSLAAPSAHLHQP